MQKINLEPVEFIVNQEAAVVEDIANQVNSRRGKPRKLF